MIEKISHVTLIVADLDNAKRVVVDVLGGTEIYDSVARNMPGPKEKFFDVNGTWIGLIEGTPSEKSYNHIAFKISESSFAKAEKAVNALGLEIIPSPPTPPGSGIRCIYFYDFDNHLFELTNYDLAAVRRYLNVPS